jgi:hypothetical protein
MFAQRNNVSTVLMLSDLSVPWCIRVVATLRVADHIDAGTSDLADLAELTSCDAECLGRVLRRLVDADLFIEHCPDGFSLTPTGRELLDERVLVRLDLNGIGDRYARIWNGLLKSVHSGTSAYYKVFGVPIWRDFDRSPALADSYEKLMGPSGHDVPEMNFPISGGWDDVNSVILLGGETGVKLVALLRLHPHLQGTLLDLPRAVSRSIVADSDVADRVTTVAQSYFDPLPADYDVYLLYGTMRAWSDTLCVRLLTRCAEALRVGRGRVVIVTEEARTTKQSIVGGRKHDDLLELMVGGKEVRSRTVSEFRALAERAGLAVSHVGESAGLPLVIECEVGAQPCRA